MPITRANSICPFRAWQPSSSPRFLRAKATHLQADVAWLVKDIEARGAGALHEGRNVACDVAAGQELHSGALGQVKALANAALHPLQSRRQPSHGKGIALKEAEKVGVVRGLENGWAGNHSG